MWKVLESKELFSSGLFSLNVEKCEMPDGRIMPRYYVMRFPDWVNIFAMDREGQVLLVKQYRQASGLEHLEVPGGSMDPHRQETAMEAAQRELLEETGHQCEKLIDLGHHFPNPALQSNRIHTYLALDCEKVSEPNLDPYEELTVEKCHLEEIKDMMASGRIDHSLMLASIYRALAYLDRHKP